MREKDTSILQNWPYECSESVHNSFCTSTPVLTSYGFKQVEPFTTSCCDIFYVGFKGEFLVKGDTKKFECFLISYDFTLEI